MQNIKKKKAKDEKAQLERIKRKIKEVQKKGQSFKDITQQKPNSRKKVKSNKSSYGFGLASSLRSIKFLENSGLVGSSKKDDKKQVWQELKDIQKEIKEEMENRDPQEAGPVGAN